VNDPYSYFPNSQIEIINPNVIRGQIRFALFDFDGTLSLIREGWQAIMIPMMEELLLQTPHHEDPALVTIVVKEFVTRLTGKQTIYQMIQLCEEISIRGGQPREPLFYKHLYNDRLNQHIVDRISGLKSGQINPEAVTVPGTFAWLDILKRHKVICYLASGTDEAFVTAETDLLGLTPYFAGVYGAQEQYQNFSKKMVIDRIIQSHNLHGPEFAAFGDGYVEIEDSKSVNCVAIGLATDEKNRKGIDEWKRNRLIAAGADVIIPDFQQADRLEAFLFQD
jgi:phosphoglycolate phosphatase